MSAFTPRSGPLVVLPVVDVPVVDVPVVDVPVVEVPVVDDPVVVVEPVVEVKPVPVAPPPDPPQPKTTIKIAGARRKNRWKRMGYKRDNATLLPAGSLGLVPCFRLLGARRSTGVDYGVGRLLGLGPCTGVRCSVFGFRGTPQR